MERMKADILVIGGGLAGLCAAVEGAEGGRRVLLAGKRQIGRSGNVIVAAGNVSVCAPAETPDPFAEDVLLGGAGVGDPALADRFARASHQVLLWLDRFGIRFLGEGGVPSPRTNPGHRTARTLMLDRGSIPPQTAGLALTLPLLKRAQELGVEMIDHLPVVELLLHEGRVVGALAGTADRPVELRANATILACGGGGRVYRQSNNTTEMTGDGIALASRAGARLRDMEFVQFHPTMGFSPLRTILPTTLFADGAILRDRNGARVLEPFGVDDAVATRDLMARAIYQCVQDGRGVEGGVHLDLSALPAAARSRYADLLNLLWRRGCVIDSDAPVVGVAVHFLMGGVEIDTDARTSLPGLFAAGEVTGGLHGANRLGGDALTEAIVFGRIAGRSAADALEHASGEWGRVAALSFNGEKGVLPYAPTVDAAASEAIRNEVRDLLWSSAGVVRTGSELAAALARVKILQEQAPRSPFALSCRSTLEVAELILTASLLREESRGAHYRLDFPESTPAWQSFIRLERAENGSLHHQVVPVLPR